MPPLENLFAVLLAGLALSVTPGPSMLYVLSRSIGQGRAAGLASALGLCAGGVLLAIATALGLASLFERFDWISITLQYVGSGYLIWLAISVIRSAQQSLQLPLEVASGDRIPLATVFWQGVLVEILNPKTVLFFALFLPPFVDTTGQHAVGSSLQTQLLILGMAVPLTAIPSDVVAAYLGGTLVQTASKKRVLREGFAWIGGLVLIAIAVNLHLRVL
jgi:threonine/homoserine/homoserine lactone efflux protein